MDWVLVVVIILNGVQQTVEVKPMSSFWCPIMAEKLVKKQVTVDRDTLTIVSAKCELK